MSEPTGRSRGNPAPRRALARFSPKAADEGTTDAGTPADETAETSPAAAPGGTAGRDLLIPGRRGSRPSASTATSTPPGNGKNGPTVPSLADLMPPAVPSGRRGGHAQRPKQPPAATTPGGGKEKSAKTIKEKNVEVTVHLPKSVRKQLKARAHELGLTPDEAVARLVQVWLET